MDNLLNRFGRFVVGLARRRSRLSLSKISPFALESDFDRAVVQELEYVLGLDDAQAFAAVLDEFLPQKPDDGKPWWPAWVALHMAAATGRAELCERLCSWDPRLPKIPDQRMRCALMVSVNQPEERLECVRALLPWSDASRAGGIFEQSTALNYAIVQGHVESALFLLPSSPIEGVGGGDAPLATAALHGQVGICNALLAAGADPQWASPAGDTILHRLAGAPMASQDADAVLRCAALFLTPQSLRRENDKGQTPAQVAKLFGVSYVERFFEAAQTCFDEGAALASIAPAAPAALKARL